MLVNLCQILPQAANGNGSVACFNIFGFEDAQAIISAAESTNLPVIIATNKDMVDQLGVRCLAGMLLPLIQKSTAQICLHLDHCYEEAVIYQAMGAGYSSVMFDGSQLPLDENITRTRQVVNIAHSLGLSVEGEIGSVPYHEGRDHIRTEATVPEQARMYVDKSNIDAVAISVGNIHRLSKPSAEIDFTLLQEIESLVDIPLVIHGTTGIANDELLRLKSTRVAKFNIGTSLRRVIGDSLRQSMENEPEKYDRQYFMSKVQTHAQSEAERMLRLLAPE